MVEWLLLTVHACAGSVWEGGVRGQGVFWCVGCVGWASKSEGGFGREETRCEGCVWRRGGGGCECVVWVRVREGGRSCGCSAVWV